MQLTAEASFLSLGAVLVIFVLIVVSSISFQPDYVVQFSEHLHRETCYVIERPSQMVTGSCYRHRLIYTWRASLFCNSCVLSLILAVSQLSLFVWDILQSVIGILNIRWVNDGMITSGPYCTAQGIIDQMAPLGTALINLVCILYGLFL